MNFIGQEHFRQELIILMDSILDGHNYNVMFRARSGMGKTTLAVLCMLNLGYRNCMYYLPDDGKLVPTFQRQQRIHTIDECHTLKDQEILYPFMDSNQYTFFILTNETGGLKEPLVNRCIPFVFLPYSQEELTQMAEFYLKKYRLSRDILIEISSKSTFPRELKILCDRLQYIFDSHGIPRSVDELNFILNTILSYDSSGISILERNYLDFLERVGGTASIDTLSYGLGIDKTTLRRDIEPALLYKKLIQITSKGRKLENLQ